MLSDDAIKEFANIIIDGFFKNPDIAKKGNPYKETAKETMFKMMLQNREGLELGMRRFHDWMHKQGIGFENYEPKDNGCNDDLRTKGDRQVHPS